MLKLIKRAQAQAKWRIFIFFFNEEQLAPLRCVMNLNLYGLYIVDSGQVSNLLVIMPLDQARYPPEIYGCYRIGKLGCTHYFRQ